MSQRPAVASWPWWKLGMAVCALILVATSTKTIYLVEPTYSTAELVLLAAATVIVLGYGSFQLRRMLRQRSSRTASGYLWMLLWISCAGVLGVRLATLQGVVVPVRIIGASMAPRLRGIHYEVRCPDCQYPFTFDAALTATSLDRIHCPNCGHHFDAQSAGVLIRRGDRVLLDRFLYVLQPPRRCDIVATNSADGMVAKRVIGLPGEQITIRAGEIFVDGKWLRKSLHEFRRTAQPVHNNAYRPQLTVDLPARWSIKSTSGQMWEAVYHSWRCYENPLPRSAEAPVSDHDWYNQGLSRSVNDVREVVLTAELKVRGSGELSFEYHSAAGTSSAVIDFAEHQLRIRPAGKNVAQRSFKLDPRSWSRHTWEFGVIDGQLVLARNAQTLIALPDPMHSRHGALNARPLAIRAKRLEVKVIRLRVDRDVYYLGPQGVDVSWASPRLEADEYLLLGDNVPVSRDGRHWGPVQRRDLLGKVVGWE